MRGMHRLTGIVLIYPASEAPNYRVGYKAAAAFCVACLLATGIFKYKDRQLRRQYASPDDPSNLHRQGSGRIPEINPVSESDKYN